MEKRGCYAEIAGNRMETAGIVWEEAFLVDAQSLVLLVSEGVGVPKLVPEAQEVAVSLPWVVGMERFSESGLKPAGRRPERLVPGARKREQSVGPVAMSEKTASQPVRLETAGVVSKSVLGKWAVEGRSPRPAVVGVERILVKERPEVGTLPFEIGRREEEPERPRTESASPSRPPAENWWGKRERCHSLGVVPVEGERTEFPGARERPLPGRVPGLSERVKRWRHRRRIGAFPERILPGAQPVPGHGLPPGSFAGTG
jgi:hypothetical protein